jgi:hypothetical protein
LITQNDPLNIPNTKQPNIFTSAFFNTKAQEPKKDNMFNQLNPLEIRNKRWEELNEDEITLLRTNQDQSLASSVHSLWNFWESKDRTGYLLNCKSINLT